MATDPSGNFAFVGATIGAILGAALWGAITYFTNYEVGIVAWAIGGLVGAGSAVLGGRGGGMGMVCALLAVAAICGGKYFAVRLSMGDFSSKMIAATVTREMYDEELAYAKKFAELPPGENAVRQFMIDEGLTEHAAIENIPTEDVRTFVNTEGHELKKFANFPPTFDNWKRERTETISATMGSIISPWDAIKASLGIMDALFFLLGVSTAFKVGSGLSEE